MTFITDDVKNNNGRHKIENKIIIQRINAGLKAYSLMEKYIYGD